MINEQFLKVYIFQKQKTLRGKLKNIYHAFFKSENGL